MNYASAPQFRLLGAVEASVGGRPIELGHPKQRAVLAVLLVEAGRTVPIDRLVTRVWGDRPPPRARVTVSGYVSRLRAAFAAHGGPRIAQRSGAYTLIAEVLDVDLYRFADLVARARRARAEGHDAEAVGLLDAALGLWRGEPFTGAETPWLSGLRVTLEAARYAAVLDRNDLVLAASGHADLVGGLAALAAAHPLDERLAGQLVLTLYRCGRRAEALWHYDRLRRRLADELGTDPGPPLRRLHQQMLTADSALAVV